jgi:hypothetical protein
MAALDPEPLDEGGRVGGGGGELLTEPLGQRRGERVDLPDGRLSVGGLSPPWVGGAGHPSVQRTTEIPTRLCRLRAEMAYAGVRSRSAGEREPTAAAPGNERDRGRVG